MEQRENKFVSTNRARVIRALDNQVSWSPEVNIKLLLSKSINELPDAAFVSKETFETALRDQLKGLAEAERTPSKESIFSFEILTGKLKIEKEVANFHGIRLKPGDVDVSKIILLVTSGASGCTELIDCGKLVKEKILDRLFTDDKINEYVKTEARAEIPSK